MTASIIAGNLMSMALSVSTLEVDGVTFFSLPEIHRYPPENSRIVHPQKIGPTIFDKERIFFLTSNFQE